MVPWLKNGAAQKYDPATLSPRFKTAVRLYASGAVATMGEAADAAGLTRGTFYSRKCSDKRVDILLHQIDKQIHEGTVDMTKVIQTLGRRAIVNIAHLAEDAQKEDIRFRANQDLADRSPETAKTHKFQMETDVKLLPGDIERLRDSLVESAKAREQYARAIIGDFVTVNEESSIQHMKQLPALLNGTGHTDPG